MKAPGILAAMVLAGLPAFAADGPSPAASLGEDPAPACRAAPGSDRVAEEGFVEVGGIAQWVTLHGESCANPAVLMLHGGPGNPLSPYAAALYGAWEREFTLVQWDQRGTGRTFGRSPPAEGEALTLERMVADGVAVAQHVTRRLGKRQVILMGGSWGSVLGVNMARRRPDLFLAYVGTHQMVSRDANEAAFYEGTLAAAVASGDAKAVAALKALGAPPWVDPRAFGIVRRAARALEARVTTPAPERWWRPAPAYATAGDERDREAGEEYSWIQFVGVAGNGMAKQVDLPALGTRFDLPVYLVQGERDLLTPSKLTRAYFDSVTAPEKAWVLVPAAGHEPNEAIVAAQYRVLKERVIPRLRRPAPVP